MKALKSPTLLKMSTQRTSAVAMTPLLANTEILRTPSETHHPSVWGNCFISYTSDDAILHAWCEEATALKENVKRTLNTNFVSNTLEEKLRLIDSMQRLGISYHFDAKLEEALEQIHDYYVNNLYDAEDNLQTASLLFRLLREYGYNVSCDIFQKFKDKSGSIKGYFTKDVEDMLSLYEATNMRAHEEAILDEALTSVRANLQSVVSDLEPCLARQVLCALNRPIRRRLPRLEACDYIPFYQENKSHDEMLLKLAKLDFNILQKQHRKELSIVSKWWKDLRVDQNLSFARDRMVECYFWALGVYYEPQYALARKFLTKVTTITSIIDDIYDNFGIASELKLFTEAVQRWDMNAMVHLPEYMKITYEALLDIYDEMEQEMAKEGKVYAVHYAKDAMKRQVRAYYEETKWLGSEEIPTMEEYLKVALVSSGYPMLATTLFVGMGEIATKEVFDWLLSEPQILRATSFICRIMNDLVRRHEIEQQRPQIPSAVECYMNQFGVSKQEAYAILNKGVEDAWKDINQAFLEPQPIPITFLTRILNLARVMDLLYKEEDCYTNGGTKMERYVARLLVNPVEID